MFSGSLCGDGSSSIRGSIGRNAALGPIYGVDLLLGSFVCFGRYGLHTGISSGINGEIDGESIAVTGEFLSFIGLLFSGRGFGGERTVDSSLVFAQGRWLSSSD